MLWDGGSGYRMYVFEESTRCCAIDHKGRGRKEVIYLRVADVSCTRGVRESTGLSYGGPCGGVLWQRYVLELSRFLKQLYYKILLNILNVVNPDF